MCHACANIGSCRDAHTKRGTEACEFKCPDKAAKGGAGGPHDRMLSCGIGETPCEGNEFCDFGHPGEKNGQCVSCDFTATNALNGNVHHIHACSEVKSGKGKQACMARCNGAHGN